MFLIRTTSEYDRGNPHITPYEALFSTSKMHLNFRYKVFSTIKKHCAFPLIEYTLQPKTLDSPLWTPEKIPHDQAYSAVFCHTGRAIYNFMGASVFQLDKASWGSQEGCKCFLQNFNLDQWTCESEKDKTEWLLALVKHFSMKPGRKPWKTNHLWKRM